VFGTDGFNAGEVPSAEGVLRMSPGCEVPATDGGTALGEVGAMLGDEPGVTSVPAAAFGVPTRGAAGAVPAGAVPWASAPIDMPNAIANSVESIHIRVFINSPC